MSNKLHPLHLKESQIEVLYNLLTDCKHFPDDADPVESSLYAAVTKLYEDVCVTYEITPASKSFYETFGYYPTHQKDQPLWEMYRKAYEMNNGPKA
jgi:hypothetical protein